MSADPQEPSWLRPHRFVSLVALLLLISQPAHACTPLAAMAFIYSGPIAWAPGIGLLIAIAIKATVFAWLGRPLSPGRAVYLMVMANLFTTFMGILVAAFQFSGSLMTLIAFPVVVFCQIPACQRLAEAMDWKVSGSALAALSGALTFAAMMLWVMSEGPRSAGSYPLYWGLKLAYVLCGVTVTMGLTTLWEEWAIARMAKEPSLVYMPAVVRANLAAFVVAAGIGAAMTLPQRWSSPGFLTSLLAYLVG